MPEDLRIGVFVCECGHNIAGTVDSEAVRADASTLPNVTVAQRNRYTCSDPGQQQIKQAIAAHNLNCFVVASRTLCLHAPMFRKCFAEAGLSPHVPPRHREPLRAVLVGASEQSRWRDAQGDRRGVNGGGTPAPACVGTAIWRRCDHS